MEPVHIRHDLARTIATHHTADSAEITELKRLWWNLYNTLRCYEAIDPIFVNRFEDCMSEVTILIQTLQGN